MKRAQHARARRAPVATSTFPCVRCGRPLRRVGADPPKIRCPRCRFLIYDYPRSCAGMLVLKDDAVLLLRRGHMPRKGYVDVPGGFMDAHERMEQAARRELLEETGLRVGRVEYLGLYLDRYHLRGFGWFPTLNFYFVGRWRSGEPVPGDDAADAEWVPLSSLGSRSARYAWPHMTEVFRDLKRRLRVR
jgi:ADP-ribose pyrophosphatase YjhB (NUDIX family)